jgi:hypothetical protein
MYVWRGRILKCACRLTLTIYACLKTTEYYWNLHQDFGFMHVLYIFPVFNLYTWQCICTWLINTTWIPHWGLVSVPNNFFLHRLVGMSVCSTRCHQSLVHHCLIMSCCHDLIASAPHQIQSLVPCGHALLQPNYCSSLSADPSLQLDQNWWSYLWVWEHMQIAIAPGAGSSYPADRPGGQQDETNVTTDQWAVVEIRGARQGHAP